MNDKKRLLMRTNRVFLCVHFRISFYHNKSFMGKITSLFMYLYYFSSVLQIGKYLKKFERKPFCFRRQQLCWLCHSEGAGGGEGGENALLS